MYYTYVLQSTKDGNFYTGFTKNLKLRFEQHNNRLVESTKNRGPFKLIYYEACLDQNDAINREKYLKSYRGFWEQGTFYPFTSLLTAMGYPLGIAALIGLSYALIRRRSADLILLSQPFLLAAFLMLFATKVPHHMLIAFPALSILSASLLVDLVSWFIRPHIWQRMSLILVSILVLVNPATIAFQESYRLTLPDTRELSKGWVEENIPVGSKIVMDSGRYYLSHFGPPLRLSRWTLEQFIIRGESLSGEFLARRDGTRRVGYSGEGEYFKQQLRTLGDQSGYDIVQILHDPGSEKADVLNLDEYILMGVRYAIISSIGWKNYFQGSEIDVRYPVKAAKYRNFYKALEDHTTLLKVFSPSDKIAGPTLRIYRLP